MAERGVWIEALGHVPIRGGRVHLAVLIANLRSGWRRAGYGSRDATNSIIFEIAPPPMAAISSQTQWSL